MFDRNRIRTPWRHRWRRFRYSALPVIIFAASLALTFWMWGRQVRYATAVGEVERFRVDVISGLDGRLEPLSGLQSTRPFWNLFDPVKQGDVIARLDDSPTQAALETARRELQRLQGEIGSAQAQVKLDQARIEIDHFRERMGLQLQVEQLRVDLVNLRATIAEDEGNLGLVDVTLEYLKKPTFEGAVSRQAIDEKIAEKKVITDRLRANKAAIRELVEQIKVANKRLDAFPQSPLPPEMESIITPLQAAISTQEATMKELELQLDLLVIRAPISGTIAAIYSWPGQNVQAGDPILTIAAEEGDAIVGYIREDQNFRPTEGMEVEVRPRTGQKTPLIARVDRVGSQFEAGPLQLQRDPQRPDWVLPVWIKLPQEQLKFLDVRPGEPVDLQFKLPSPRRPG